MRILTTILAASLLCVTPAMAEDAGKAPVSAPESGNPEAAAEAAPETVSPVGNFRDEFGTSFTFLLCGEGTDLCGILTDVQGESRTEENLAYLNQQVVQATQTAPNQWKGTVIYDGAEAAATITQTGPDSIEIEGCRALILCQTLVFSRV